MANNPNRSNLDQNQIIQRVMDESQDRLRVDAVASIEAGQMELIISQTDDSIRLGDGTNLVTATIDGSKVGLDVNVVGGIVEQSGLSGGIRTTSFIVTDTPSAIPSSPLLNRNTLSVRVVGSNKIYIGNSSVTASNGYPKMTNEEVSMDIKDNSAVILYAVCDSGNTSEIRIIEIA